MNPFPDHSIWDARRLWSASDDTDQQQASEDAEDTRERVAVR